MSRKSWCYLLIAVFSANFALAESAFSCREKLPEKQSNEIIPRVEKQYQNIKDLEADFSQQSYFVGLDQRNTSQGRVYFKKPGMMDWDYLSPEKQQFVADGHTLWFFQPELNQVTLGNFSQSFSSDLPVSFLLGVGNLSERFRLETACRSEDGFVLKLKPLKSDASLEEFYLLVDEKSFMPKGARIVDVGGNETSIIFSFTVVNKGLDSKRFTFLVPKNVDVIDKRKNEPIVN